MKEQEPQRRWHRFGTMTWPLPDPDLSWRIRFAPESVNGKDMMYLASLLDAYQELINCGRAKREHVTRELRAGITGDNK
jgi:hypothetical protein